MAKIIKCPNCGDNVEIPTGFTGQVINCEGCGTGLRLRSRKHRDAAGGGAYGDAGGDMSGSMSATQIGPADPNDPPSLGSECAVCGATVGDLSELTEDRGRLVCPDCLRKSRKGKGASTAGGGGGSPGYSPEPALDDTVHHGKMLTVDATFLAATLMAAVVLGTQAWLNYNPKPVGSKVLEVASPTTTRPTIVTWEEKNADRLLAMAKKVNDAFDLSRYDDAVTAQRELEDFVADNRVTEPRLTTALKDAQLAANDASQRLAAQLQRQQEMQSQAAAAPATAPANDAVAMKPADPRDDGIFGDQAPSEAQAAKALDAGFAALDKGEWDEAVRVLNDLAPLANRRPTNPQELLAMAGVTAAHVGAGRFDEAVAMGRRVLLANAAERSARLNVAMAELSRARSGVPPRTVLDDLQKYLSDPQTPVDEVAYDVFGTAVARAEAQPKSAETVAPYKRTLDAYTARLNGTRPNEQKWGAQWLPKAEVVLREDNVKLMTQLIEQLVKDEKAAYNKMVNSQLIGGDETRAKRELEQVQSDLEKAKASLAKAKPWLEKFTPVIPHRAGAAAAAKRDA